MADYKYSEPGIDGTNGRKRRVDKKSRPTKNGEDNKNDKNNWLEKCRNCIYDFAISNGWPGQDKQLRVVNRH